MPVSTSGGRAFRDIITDPQFQKIGKKAKSQVCHVVKKLLNESKKGMITCLQKEDWTCVYDSFTGARRLIEFQVEGCK